MIQSGNEFFLNNSSAAPTQRGFRSQSRVGDRLRTARPRLILALASIIPIPVSYTHLDVYKRQVFAFAFGYIRALIQLVSSEG